MMNNVILKNGNWYEVSQCDPRVIALYRRHYSSRKINHGIVIDYYHLGIAGPGKSLVMLTPDAKACIGWIKNIRNDDQNGINCFFFRNEGNILSSSLIIEADEFAFKKWNDERRHFTFVNPRKIKSTNPGYCFQQAGWRRCGETPKGLIIGNYPLTYSKRLK